MLLQDTTPTKDKIIEAIKKRGPSLPVHIANEMKLSMLFASAFLADLLSSKELKISHMKVGNSPIYLIPGQEFQLEDYSKYLKSREKDAYLLLKEKKFLEDEKQEPAIRVALREIKDFAIPFQKQEKIFWRFFTIPESEFYEKQSEEIVKKINKNIVLDSEEKTSKEKKSKDTEIQISQKEPNFINKILCWLKKNEEIKLLEETEVKKKEFLGIGRIESDLGEMEVLLVGKDKKKVSSKDLEKLLKKIIESKKIVILFSNGELEKKAIEDYRQLKNLIFIKNIDKTFKYSI